MSAHDLQSQVSSLDSSESYQKMINRVNRNPPSGTYLHYHDWTSGRSQQQLAGDQAESLSWYFHCDNWPSPLKHRITRYSREQARRGTHTVQQELNTGLFLRRSRLAQKTVPFRLKKWNCTTAVWGNTFVHHFLVKRTSCIALDGQAKKTMCGHENESSHRLLRNSASKRVTKQKSEMSLGLRQLSSPDHRMCQMVIYMTSHLTKTCHQWQERDKKDNVHGPFEKL